MGRPRVMRETDLGTVDPGESLMPLEPLPTDGEIMLALNSTKTAFEVTGLRDGPLTKLRALIRSSKKEQRFVGGLNERRMKTFYLIDSKKVVEILGGEP